MVEKKINFEIEGAKVIGVEKGSMYNTKNPRKVFAFTVDNGDGIRVKALIKDDQAKALFPFFSEGVSRNEEEDTGLGYRVTKDVRVSFKADVRELNTEIKVENITNFSLNVNYVVV